MELERLWGVVRWERPRDGGGGASPKMKNLMKAPINSTTESCPRRKPCVKDSLAIHQSWNAIFKGLWFGQFTYEDWAGTDEGSPGAGQPHKT